MYHRIWDVVRLKQPGAQEAGVVLVQEGADSEQRITDLFLAIGVPPHLKGYQYLKEAVRLAMENRMIVYSITKPLYPRVAERFGVTPTKVCLLYTSRIFGMTPAQFQPLLRSGWPEYAH